jgi:hypothetical protein
VSYESMLAITWTARMQPTTSTKTAAARWVTLNLPETDFC